VIETPIYDSETGEESTEIITSYDQAKKALLHEFQYFNFIPVFLKRKISS